MQYMFRCQKCLQTVEINHLIHEPHPTQHENCGGTLTRIFSTTNVIYRGSGFYSVDSRLKPVDPIDYDSTVHCASDLR